MWFRSLRKRLWFTWPLSSEEATKILSIRTEAAIRNIYFERVEPLIAEMIHQEVANQLIKRELGPQYGVMRSK